MKNKSSFISVLVLHRCFKLFLALLLSCTCLHSWGQGIALMGYVKDDFTRKAVEGLTVTLMHEDGSLISDSLLTAVLDNGTVWVYHNFPRQRQKVVVRVTHPEYETAEKTFEVKHFGRNTQKQLPDILITRKTMKTTMLDEFVVRPTKIKMAQRGDTIVYDATAFNLPKGSMLDDLVRELPGAELKPNGEIFVNGKKIDYLMLNSREFFRGNNQVMLRNLPYYTVKDIKVYNRTTDLSAFLGREAENKEYVMDVQLKKIYKQGYLGNVEAGYGTHDRYMGRAFALRFTDNSRITLYGNTNNTNDTSSPVNGGQWGGASDTNGEKRQHMAGGELFWHEGAFRNTLRAKVTGTGIDTESQTTAQVFLADGSTSFSRSKSMSDTKETNVNIYDYWQVMKNLQWWVSGDIIFDHNSRHGNASSTYASSLTGITLPDTLSYRSSQQYRDGHDNELALIADATRKLAWGDEVTFEARYRHNSAEHELFGKSITSQTLQTPHADYRHEYDKAREARNFYSLKVKYTVPFLKGPAVSLAYNPTYRYASDRDNIFRLDRLEDWSVTAGQPLRLLPSMTDMAASCIDLDNTYSYKDVAAAHALALGIGQRRSTGKGTKRNVEFTFPITFTHERMEYTRGRIDTVGRRNYTVITPRLYYESIWKEERYTFHASTSYLTEAANYLQTMPFRDDRNPLMVREGNSGLKQSWIYNAETSLSMRLRSMAQLFSCSASANIYGNQVANGFTFNPNTGIYTYRPENVNGNWDMKGDAYYSISFGKWRCFEFEDRASANFLHSVDIASVDGSTQAMLSKVNTTLVNDRASISFTWEEQLRMEAFGSLTLRHTVSALDMFETINAADFNYGMKARYTIPLLELTAQTDITMYSRRGYGSSEFNTDDLMWNATLSYPFMKGKLVVYADALDILHNRRSTQYAVNAQGRTITWQRSMPSYAMLRAQWRFNYNPKKK